MDGAIRFTQRDALAAMLITGVNIVAGLIIGVVPARPRPGDRGRDLHDPDGRRRPGHRDSGAAGVDVGRPDHDARRVGIAPRRGSRRRSCSRGRGRWPSAPACWSRWRSFPACRSSRSSSSAALLGAAAYADRASAGVGDGRPKRRPRAGDRRAGRHRRRSIRSASKSATRWSRWSTRSRAARC